MLNLKYTVECEHPNESLYTFVGNMYTGRIAYPLTPNQVREPRTPIACQEAKYSEPAD